MPAPEVWHPICPETQGMSPSGPSIPQAVSARALEAPDGLAISAHDDVLTYAELEWRAGALADRLCDLGVGPGMVVAG